MALSTLIELSESEYDAFASVHPYANFLNSIYSGRKFALRGWNVCYVGIRRDSELAAATLLVYTKLHGSYQYFYAPRGFLLDYTDSALLQAMCAGVKQFAKERNGLYLKIDPYVPYQEHDQDGHVVEGGFCNQKIVDDLQVCGFEHQGFTRGYDMANQCRWMSVLDVQGKDEEQLLKQMNAQTRQNVKNTIKNGIRVRELAYDELDILYDIVNRTGERRGFEYLPLSYYQQQLKTFGDHAKAYLSYLDLDDYMARIHAEQQKEEQNVETAQEGLRENPHSKNSTNRLKSAQSHLEALKKREDEAVKLREECGSIVPLAAALFLFYGKEVIYLTSGSNDQYKKFKGPYALQWALIRMTLHQGYDRYNFYGISGLFEKDEDGYGVFDFKRGFHADVVELLGDFIMPIHARAYKNYQRLQKLKHMIRR